MGPAGILPAVFGIEPSNPPPPSINALPFQLVGKSSSNMIAGAAASMLRILPTTLQYSGIALLADITVAEVTTAPRVGRTTADAGIRIPRSSAHEDSTLSSGFCAQPVNANRIKAVDPQRASKLLLNRLKGSRSMRATLEVLI